VKCGMLYFDRKIPIILRSLLPRWTFRPAILFEKSVPHSVRSLKNVSQIPSFEDLK